MELLTLTGIILGLTAIAGMLRYETKARYTKIYTK